MVQKQSVFRSAIAVSPSTYSLPSEKLALRGDATHR